MLRVFKYVSLSLIGSLSLLSSSVVAGPQESYGDQCQYTYKGEWRNVCLTKRGRVLDGDGKLEGLLGKNYTTYSPPSRYGTTSFQGGYSTKKFDSVNNGNTVVEYGCVSNASGSCIGKSWKILYQYTGSN